MPSERGSDRALRPAARTVPLRPAARTVPLRLAARTVPLRLAANFAWHVATMCKR